MTSSPDSHSGLLTKKFINLIKHAEDGVLDLNKAADTLEVPSLHFTVDTTYACMMKFYQLTDLLLLTGAEKAYI